MEEEVGGTIPSSNFLNKLLDSDINVVANNGRSCGGLVEELMVRDVMDLTLGLSYCPFKLGGEL